MAMEYGEHFLLLDSGRVAFEAERASDITSSIVEHVFRVRARRVAALDDDQSYWRFTL